jgi:hypothetical protein
MSGNGITSSRDATSGYRLAIVSGALEVSARVVNAEELNLLVRVLQANKILWTNSVTSRDTEHESFTTTTKPAPDSALRLIR